MAANKDDINIKVTLDDSAFQSGLKSLTTTVTRMAKNVSSLTTSVNELQSSISKKPNTKGYDEAADAIGKVSKAASDARANLPSLRYALYDVANTTGSFYRNIVQAGTAAANFAAEYESAFTNVERTTLSSAELLDSIKRQLLNLSQQIPTTFSDLSAIAALGAQLGVATGDLAGFTKTIAEFAATTNVSIETAAQSFGALGELLNVSAAEYQNFGSAVAYVGVRSVATESEILSVATAIGGVANSAGLSADYVVGLSGSLASLRVPAEQSRGAMTRLFQEVNRSAAGSGVDMQLFANILGTTKEQAQLLAETDMESFFNMFINGLSGLDTQQLTTSLDALSLSDIRVTNVLTRLSRNTDVLASSLADSSKAFADGTFLSQAYALRVDDLASKFKLLQNSVQNLGAKIGKVLEPVLKPIVDFIRTIVNQLNAALATDVGTVFVAIASGATVLVGAITGLITALALATASLFAIRFAIGNLGWEASQKGMQGFIASLFGVSAGSDAAAASISKIKFALISTGIGAAVVIIGSLVAALMQATTTSKGMFESLVTDTAGLTDALAADTQAYNAALASGNTALANSFAAIEYSGTTLNKQYDDTAEKVYFVSQVVGSDLTNAYDYASDAIQQNTRYVGDNTIAWMKNKLIQSEAFQNMAGKSGVADYFRAINFDFAEAAKLAATGGADAVNQYFKNLSGAALKSGRVTLEQVGTVDKALQYELLGSNNKLSKLPAYGPGQWVLNMAAGVIKALPWLADALNGIANLFGADISNITGDTALALGGLAEEASLMELAFGDAGATGAGAMDDISSGAGGAGKKVRLLTDYANDLSSTWDRAFDIKFSGQSTLDAITTSFSDIAKSTDEASQKVSELQADLDSLTADKALQEYFLSVANAYGDTLAAAQIQAKINKINSQLTSTNQDLSSAQDDASTSLVGNSNAAIANRSKILDLVKSYQEHIKALAASGMSQEGLASATQQLKQDFLSQAQALGYNSNELGIYASAFDDVGKIIDNIPRDVTVEFNGNAAETAIAEFAASAQSSLGGISSSVGDITSGLEAMNKELDKSKDKKVDPPKLTTSWWDDMVKNSSYGWGVVLSSISTGWDDMWGNINKTMGPIFEQLWSNFTFPARLGSALISDITRNFQISFDAIGGMWDTYVGPVWNAGIGEIETWWNGVVQNFQLTMGAIGSFWDTYVTTPIELGISGIVQWWDQTVSIPLQTAFASIGEWWNQYARLPIEIAIASISSWWKTHVSGPIQVAMDTLSSYWRNRVVLPITNAIGGIAATWNNIMANIKSAFDNLFSGFQTTLSNFMSGVRSVFPAAFDVVKPIINTIFGTEFAEGGYTGAGGKYEAAGIVHRGEYVVPKSQVNQVTRVPYFMEAPRQYANGGYVGPAASTGGGMVSLSPEDRALLRNVGGSGEIILYANNEAIARSSNAGNRAIVATGGLP